jgi:hypothetical protein
MISGMKEVARERDRLRRTLDQIARLLEES